MRALASSERSKPNAEQQFVAEIDKFKFIESDMQASLAKMDAWRGRLMKALADKRADVSGLKDDSALAAMADEVHTKLQASMQGWSGQWASRAPVKALADSFGDQAILLVFGKVNAGKSSFCNFLADRFAAQGLEVQYFYLDGGRIVETKERFKEGVTETTARIQGARLGSKLVLLDTPGLHSVTGENGDLTKRYTDSADGVLWLTSSASPGQVQELDELCKELQSGKPLLPVVTKSDVFEEDEIAEQIVKILRNKTPQNRTLQESDVHTRALDKLKAMSLDAGLLCAPTSVSTHTAREQGLTAAALEAGGFERLYAGLLAITPSALARKRRKAGEMMLRHLEDHVLGTLHTQVLPPLRNLTKQSQEVQLDLKRREPQIASELARAVTVALPGLLDAHAATRDVKAVCAAVSKLSADELSRVMGEALADYAIAMDDSLTQLAPQAGFEFEDRAVEVRVSKGAAKRTATGAAGAAAGVAAGAAIGSFVPGPGTIIGGLIGGLLGGWGGSKAGKHFEETEIQRRVVGVSYEGLLAALEAEVRKNMPALAAHMVSQCQQTIDQLMKDLARVERVIARHEKELLALKEELRSECV